MTSNFDYMVSGYRCLFQRFKHELRPEVVVLQIQGSLETLLSLCLPAELLKGKTLPVTAE